MHAKPLRSCMDALNKRAVSDTILILETDEYLASLLNMLLSREGFRLTTVYQPSLLNQYITNHEPASLILLDTDWLNYDQFNIVDAIRTSNKWKLVPILLMMKYYSAESINIALEMGVSDYIVQPFKPIELMGQVQRHIVTLQ